MKIDMANARESVKHRINTNLRMYINQEYTNYPPHWHTDIEMICPTEGNYKVICGNQTYNLDEGDILMICPAVLHEIFALSLGTRIYIQADFSKPTSLTEIDKAFNLMSPALHISARKCPSNLYIQFSNWINTIKDIYFGSAPPVQISEGKIGRSLMAFTELEPYGEVEIYSILMQFISLAGKNLNLFQNNSSETHESNLKNTVSMSDVCTYISEHFTEDINLESISSYAGFSKYHFDRIFSDYAGTTFYQFLQKKRINFAQLLLSNPALSITDIAYQSGFASSQAFTRTFKKCTGYSPSQYRMLNEESHPLPANPHFLDVVNG